MIQEGERQQAPDLAIKTGSWETGGGQQEFERVIRSSRDLMTEYVVAFRATRGPMDDYDFARGDQFVSSEEERIKEPLATTTHQEALLEFATSLVKGIKPLLESITREQERVWKREGSEGRLQATGERHQELTKGAGSYRGDAGKGRHQAQDQEEGGGLRLQSHHPNQEQEGEPSTPCNSRRNNGVDMGRQQKQGQEEGSGLRLQSCDPSLEEAGGSSSTRDRSMRGGYPEGGEGQL